MMCVAAALKKEIDFFLDGLDGIRTTRVGSRSCYEGSLACRPLRVVRTGMGRAAEDARLYDGCSLVVSTGFCGALSPLLARGDFVVSTAVLARPDVAQRAVPIPPEAKRSIESAARELGAVLRFGATFTADRVIRTPEEKAALHGESGAISVDMEDFYRLQAAERLGIPCVSVRVVLDGQGDRVPSFRSALRIPSDAAALLRGANLCARSLARLLARFVEKFEMA